MFPSYADSDKVALVGEYSLSWSEKHSRDPGDIIYKFITGKERHPTQPVTPRKEKDDDAWVIFGLIFSVMGFFLILVKILPPQAWACDTRK